MRQAKVCDLFLNAVPRGTMGTRWNASLPGSRAQSAKLLGVGGGRSKGREEMRPPLQGAPFRLSGADWPHSIAWWLLTGNLVTCAPVSLAPSAHS
jgi:hypothetical protein